MNQRMLIGTHLLLSFAAAALTGCMMDDDDGSSDMPGSSGGSGAGPSFGGAKGDRSDLGTGGDDSDESIGIGGVADPKGTGGAEGGGGPVEPVGLQVMIDGRPAPADLSCLGMRTAPSENQSEGVTLDARAFGIADEMGNPVVVPGLEVQIFANNQIPTDDACEAGCTVASDNGDGSYTFDAPENGWIAYRTLVRPAGNWGPATLRTMEVNFLARPEEGLNTIFEPVLDGLHASISISQDEDAALLAGRFLDCQGRFIEGGRVSLRDADGNAIPVNGETRPIYIGEMGPDPRFEHTTLSGQWSFINAPTNKGMMTVELRSENDVLVGCELAPVAPSSMSVVRVFPLRADAAAVCEKL